MKNSLFLLGAAAVVALSSCSQSEVMEVAENRAIGFNAFVDNNTRAAIDLTKANLEKFYVFGDYDLGASIAFSNTEVKGTNGGAYTPVNPAYWMTGKTYTFGAYANGKYVAAGPEGEPAEISAKLSNVEFSNGTLTITKYEASDDHDLIATVVTNVAAPDAGADKSVPLTFKHLLSKIKFTFSTTASPEAFRMEVSNLKFNGIKTGAKCVMNGSELTNVTWSEGSAKDYTIATLGDYAVTSGSASTEEILVIPQANSAIEASFTVTIYDEQTYDEDGVNTPIATNDFTANLATATDANWKPGNVYNYTATINPEKVDGKLKPITFTVEEVTDWNPVKEDITSDVK